MAAPYVFASGAWRQTKGAWVFASGAWRQLKSASVFTGGAWRTMSWSHDVIIQVERWEDADRSQGYYGFISGQYGGIPAGAAWPGVGTITSLYVAQDPDANPRAIFLGTSPATQRAVTASFSLPGTPARTMQLTANAFTTLPEPIREIFEWGNSQADQRLYVTLS